MMSAFIRRVTVVVALVAVVCGASAGAAGANQSIGPNQHFSGLVNGSNVDAVVYTVCPGPATLGRTGKVLAGQTFAVARLANGAGYTGLFRQVYVWIAQDASVPGPQQVKLTTYGTEHGIPAAVRVPCDGTGQVEFSSCPRLAPCAAGWIPDIVTVRFVNVAV